MEVCLPALFLERLSGAVDGRCWLLLLLLLLLLMLLLLLLLLLMMILLLLLPLLFETMWAVLGRLLVALAPREAVDNCFPLPLPLGAVLGRSFFFALKLRFFLWPKPASNRDDT